MAKKSVSKAVILGGGVAGLACGWKLSEAGYGVHLLEKNSEIGGMASTFRYKNFLLDTGPHKIFSLMEDVLREVINLVGKKEILTVPKKSRIYMNGKFLNYPVTLMDLLINLGPVICGKCAFSYIGAEIKNTFSAPSDKSFADWVSNRFGKVIYQLIFAPYARKIWGDPRSLAVELASTRIAIPHLWEMVKQMILKLPSSSVISAPFFYYPRLGVIEIPKRLGGKILKNKGKIETGQTVSEINVKDHKVSSIVYGNKRQIGIGKSDAVVSTIPLPILLKLMRPEPPKSVLKAAAKLQTRNLILFYLILDQDRVSDDSWLFFPESKFIFNRVFEQKNFSRYMIPKGKTTLCLEITCDAQSPVWKKTTDELYHEIIGQLEKTGLIKRESVISYFDKRLAFAYPIYDLSFRNNLEVIFDWIDAIDNLYTVGRQGAFGYTGTLDSIDMGMTVAKFILKKTSKNLWKKDREKFNKYIVID